MQKLQIKKTLKDKYDEAINFYNNGFFKKAKKLLLELVLQKPTIWQLWFLLAKSHQNLQEYKKAITCFNMALVLDAKNEEAHFYLALCFLSLNEKIKANQAFKNALKFCKNDLLKDQILILQKQNSL